MDTMLFQRRIPVEEGYDVIVCGGGPAGVAAAVCAARLGARVLLAEATGCLGGTATSGLVTAFDPMADGERMLVGGFMREVVEEVYARGFTGPQVTPDYWRRYFHCWTPFNPEGLKLVLDEKVAAAGVEVRFFTRVVDVEGSAGRLDGVVLNNVEGFTFVCAKTFIDATGDAVLAALAGVACREAGRDTEHIMPPTLCSIVSGIDWSKCLEPDGRLTNAPRDQQRYVDQAVADGFFSYRDRHVPGAFRIGEHTAMLNAGHVFGMDALRCRSLSDGMMEGRRLAQEFVAFYRKYVPGFENIEHVTTASIMGVRESRRIVGEYELCYADYCARRKFADQIGLFCKSVDIHVYDDSPEQYRRYFDEFNHTDRYRPGECYGIPYRILVPKGFANLWVAGRCVSTDVKVHGSLRVQPAASMMGQAAGTAAAQAAASGETAFGLDTARLCDTLRAAGATLE